MFNQTATRARHSSVSLWPCCAQGVAYVRHEYGPDLALEGEHACSERAGVSYSGYTQE